MMTRLITDEMLLYKMDNREAENESQCTFGQIKIDLYKLITLGVVLCWGSHKLKARVLYNVIQTHIQEFIVPNDRMDDVLRNIIVFSAVLNVKRACREAKETDYAKAEIPIALVDDEMVDEVKEEFLDAVFGTESKLERGLFLSKVESEQCSWILDAELVRAKVKEHLKARKKAVPLIDRMTGTPKTKPKSPQRQIAKSPS